MTHPNATLQTWLRKATPSQARQVADIAETSVPHLRHVAAGRRQMSAELAQRVAHASKELHQRGLRLDQRELCTACARCLLAN